MRVSRVLLKKNVNFYLNYFNTVLISLLFRTLKKKVKSSKQVGCLNFYVLHVVSNSRLILFYSEKRHIKTYGLTTNWKTTGYFEIYHPMLMYRVKVLPNSAKVSPGKCND